MTFCLLGRMTLGGGEGTEAKCQDEVNRNENESERTKQSSSVRTRLCWHHHPDYIVRRVYIVETGLRVSFSMETRPHGHAHYYHRPRSLSLITAFASLHPSGSIPWQLHVITLEHVPSPNLRCRCVQCVLASLLRRSSQLKQVDPGCCCCCCVEVFVEAG